MAGVYFGDIVIPFITDKNTSIDREVVEKNFVDEPPQVFELTPNLEAGTYTAILNETTHPRNETFEEQSDAVQSMSARHVTEFPIELGGDQGHVMVDASSVAITPSQEIREAELEVRFMGDSTYRPAVVVDSTSFNSVFDTTPHESVLPLAATTQNVEDGSGNALSPLYTVESESGTIELYQYSTKMTVEYDRGTEYTLDERTAPVRLYKSNGSRVYSDTQAIALGSWMENELIECVFDDPESTLKVYDDTDGSWRSLGTVNVAADDGYAPRNETYGVEADFTNSLNVEMWKGYPIAKFATDGLTDFTLTASETLSTADASSVWYRSVTNTSGDEIVLIRTSTDGSFSDDSSTLSVTGLTSTTEYTFFLGVVPGGVTVGDFARYVYNRGTWRRSLVQR